MQEEKNKQQNNGADSSLLHQNLIAEENPMQGEMTPAEEHRPGAISRLISKIERREHEAKEKRLSQEGKAAPDRASIMLAAIPFWAVAGTTLKNGLMLCIVLLITMIPASLLHFILRRKLALEEWLALPISVLVATMLASGCCTLVSTFAPALYDSLGAYLFLLVAAPVLLNAEFSGTPENIPQFWRRTFRFVLDFCLIMLIGSSIREILGYNAIFGLPLPFMGTFKLEAVRQPFFGLIFSGFLLAVIRSLRALLRRSLHRRRIAEQKTEEAGA